MFEICDSTILSNIIFLCSLFFFCTHTVFSPEQVRFPAADTSDDDDQHHPMVRPPPPPITEHSTSYRTRAQQHQRKGQQQQAGSEGSRKQQQLSHIIAAMNRLDKGKTKVSPSPKKIIQFAYTWRFVCKLIRETANKIWKWHKLQINRYAKEKMKHL